ncbi:hypothetical protein PPTG_20912 [Phytophthora nicotianae INRA-310]|uniref:Uncharacterized protein n=1 Tax=Phytophthora nicotianae (strain INRA-310) TaxID=761204 RepID=W2RCH8_PHYN3|nr:hypothetical protein PPTG_20912 [Phytophthora nicotianae INRA-310]ETN22364.1 hypothetical protein PPTG_20912 [Phytophthora nicotianae INRA-310]
MHSTSPRASTGEKVTGLTARPRPARKDASDLSTSGDKYTSDANGEDLHGHLASGQHAEQSGCSTQGAAYRTQRKFYLSQYH